MLDITEVAAKELGTNDSAGVAQTDREDKAEKEDSDEVDSAVKSLICLVSCAGE